MKNETKQTAVEWLIEQFWNNEGMLTSKKLEQAKEMEYNEGVNTFDEGYSIGYSEGYKRALDYMTLSIKNQIKARQNE